MELDESEDFVLLLCHHHPQIGRRVTEVFDFEEVNNDGIVVASGGAMLTDEEYEISAIGIRRRDLRSFPIGIRFLGGINEFLSTYSASNQIENGRSMRHEVDIQIVAEKELFVKVGEIYSLSDFEDFGFRWDWLPNWFLVEFDRSKQSFQIHRR